MLWGHFFINLAAFEFCPESIDFLFDFQRINENRPAGSQVSDVIQRSGDPAAIGNQATARFLQSTIDAFIVNGDMVHKITWDVFEDIGPKDQVDITSVSDPDITSGNYREVAKDLKPGDGNVSPREGFFASDLTKRHEMFHVRRHVRYYREALALGLKWLNGRTARSVNEVVELVGKMREKIDNYGRTKTDPSLSGEEHDAFEAGAPLYLARSEDIIKKGRAGDYP